MTEFNCESEHPLSDISFFEAGEQEKFALLVPEQIASKIISNPSASVIAIHELWRTDRLQDLYEASCKLKESESNNVFYYFNFLLYSQTIMDLMIAEESKLNMIDFLDSTLIVLAKARTGVKFDDYLPTDDFKEVIIAGGEILKDAQLLTQIMQSEKGYIEKFRLN